MVPTWYLMFSPRSSMTLAAVSTTIFFTKASSLTSPTRGIMISGMMSMPVSRRTLRAASMTARVCISAISG